MYEFLVYTGLRKTEAMTIEWRNVHEGHIHLPKTKNGNSFDLPITQAVTMLVAGRLRVAQAMDMLLKRPLKEE